MFVWRGIAQRVSCIFFVLGSVAHKFWLPKTGSSRFGQVALPCHPLMPHRQRQIHHIMLLHDFFQGLLLAVVPPVSLLSR